MAKESVGKKPYYFCVYHRKGRDITQGYFHDFAFVLGKDQKFVEPPRPPGSNPFRLIKKIGVPRFFLKNFEELISRESALFNETIFGQMVFNVKEDKGGKTASSFFYYPKYRLPGGTTAENNPESRLLSGLGYFLESACLTHLKKEHSVSLVRAGSGSSDSRVGQLQKVGLENDRTYPIDVWLNALARGVKRRVIESKKSS